MAAAPKLTIKNLREHANKEGAAFLTYEAIAFQSDNLVFIAVDWLEPNRWYALVLKFLILNFGAATIA